MRYFLSTCTRKCEWWKWCWFFSSSKNGTPEPEVDENNREEEEEEEEEDCGIADDVATTAAIVEPPRPSTTERVAALSAAPVTTPVVQEEANLNNNKPGMLSLFELRYAKRSLMTWVGIPIEGLVCLAAPTLLLVWHRLFRIWLRDSKIEALVDYILRKSVSY